MFRLSHFMRQLVEPTPVPAGTEPADAPVKPPVKPIVVWNLTRRCNLRCRHCATTSADVDFPGELTPDEAMAVLDDLGGFGVKALVLSGGEPLVRRDLFEIADRARELGISLGLSTNGTLLRGELADRVAEAGFDHVGISIDGIGATNDWFRGKTGAFDQAVAGVRACKERGVKVGVRFTITTDTAHQLPQMLSFVDREGVDRFYLSHLVYTGRGDKHRGEDAKWQHSRQAMDLLIDRAWIAAAEDMPLEIVTGNNDADAVYFLRWAENRFPAERVAHLRAHLEAWGGNASGVGIANIDAQGKVHPDSYWSDYTIGSVKETPFSRLWSGDDPMLAQLRLKPRPLKGRCGACAFLAVCGGNTRIRALQLTGDPWAEDPACYLDDNEIGLDEGNDRLTMTPFRGKNHDPAHRFG